MLKLLAVIAIIGGTIVLGILGANPSDNQVIQSGYLLRGSYAICATISFCVLSICYTGVKLANSSVVKALTR